MRIGLYHKLKLSQERVKIMNDLNTVWTKAKISEIYEQPFLTLLYQAQSVHQENFNANEVQLSTLLSIKTGACPEDCAYCPQSGLHNAEIEKEKLFDMAKVIDNAKAAKASGATRFCIGGAWRSPPKKTMPALMEMVRQVKSLGLETCMTLGMLDAGDALALKEAGLDYYNHNIDTSPEYYSSIIQSRCFQDRLDTLQNVRNAGIKVCCGGILGLGESRQDRVSFLHALASMEQVPESVPINRLIAIKGTPLENQQELDALEFIRTIATARIIMPKSFVRLSAGRENMSNELHAWCFMAGANSIFLGDKLLTADNPSKQDDKKLLAKLGLKGQTREVL